MKTIEGVQIFEQPIEVNGKVLGKIAILVGGLNSEKPMSYMSDAVSKYVKEIPHNQFVEIRLDNPWTRIVTTALQNFPFRDLTTEDSLKTSIK